MLSYLRNTFIIVINAVVAKEPFNYANVTPPVFLFKLNPAEISYMKWIVTLFFIVIFMVITALFMRYYFNNKRLLLFSILFYAVFVCIALATELIIKGFNVHYLSKFSHLVLSLVNSPVPFLLLFTLCYLKELKQQQSL